MKRISIVLILAFFSFIANGQIKFGLKVGLSTPDVPVKSLLIQNSDELSEFKLSVENASYGIHFGGFLQIPISKYFIQPEILFNSNRVEYKLSEFSDITMSDLIKVEKYQYLDIPILFGIKMKWFRVGIGPVGHVFIDSTSELTDVDGYEEKFNEFTFGWTGGIGVDIGQRLMIDARYDGDLSKYGDHITFYNHNYDFDERAGRVTLAVAFSF